MMQTLLQVATDVSEVKTSVANIELDTDSLRATAGGGIYVSCYSKKAYLDKYKLRITDGTVTKTTTISYNSDSDLYEGNLTAPFTRNSITITLLEYGSGDNQGSVATTINTSLTYSTVNIDTLIESNLAALLDVNSSFAASLYKDSLLTANAGYRSLFITKLALYDGYLSDFMKSSYDVDMESKSFDELYANRDEFLSCIDGSVGNLFLNDATVGQHIANTKQLLKWISADSVAIAKCENNSAFRGYLGHTTLTISSSAKAGGDANYVSGNLIVLSVTSGSRGNSQTCNETAYAVQQHYYPARGYFKERVGSVRGNVYVKYTGQESSQLLFGSGVSSGVKVYCTWGQENTNHWDERTIWYGNSSTTATNATATLYKFTASVTVEGCGFATVNCPSWTVERDGNGIGPLTVNGGTIGVYSPSASSVITYIDLDAE